MRGWMGGENKGIGALSRRRSVPALPAWLADPRAHGGDPPTQNRPSTHAPPPPPPQAVFPEPDPAAACDDDDAAAAAAAAAAEAAEVAREQAIVWCPSGEKVVVKVTDRRVSACVRACVRECVRE